MSFNLVLILLKWGVLGCHMEMVSKLKWSKPIRPDNTIA